MAVSRSSVLRAVAWNQVLWTAGYSLTTGGFLLYFARELGASATWISLLIVLPETVGLLGLATRSFIGSAEGRRRLYFAATMGARVVALPIPLVALAVDQGESVWIGWLIGSVIATHAIGAVAYAAYLSWLSDLMPERRWGKLFARREMAKLAILLVLPVIIGYLRDLWTEYEAFTLAGYMATFLVGQVLLAASILPMLRLPARTRRTQVLARTSWEQVRAAWGNRPMRYLLIHNWWLAVANGLTQSAFFFYSASFGPLGIGLGTYNLMSGMMRCLQIPVSSYAGRVCDRSDSLRPRVWGVLIGSSGLIFWLMAMPETWWLLWGAYVLWGGYAAANVAGEKLMVLHAPRSDNSMQIALFAQVGGFLAGVAGFVGGVVLDSLREADFGRTFVIGGFEYRFESFQLLFLVSLVARFASVLWLWPLKRIESDSVSL